MCDERRHERGSTLSGSRSSIPARAVSTVSVGDRLLIEQLGPAGRLGNHAHGASQEANAFSKPRRAVAPMTVACGSPSANRITVGSESTP